MPCRSAIPLIGIGNGTRQGDPAAVVHMFPACSGLDCQIVHSCSLDLSSRHRPLRGPARNGEATMAILLSLLFSIDSLFASLVLGVSGIERGRQRELVIAFGVCDGVASLIGAVFASPREYVAWVASNEF